VRVLLGWIGALCPQRLVATPPVIELLVGRLVVEVDGAPPPEFGIKADAACAVALFRYHSTGQPAPLPLGAPDRIFAERQPGPPPLQQAVTCSFGQRLADASAMFERVAAAVRLAKSGLPLANR